MRTNRRAWENGIKNIEELLTWLYDQDILNKGEKAKKDSIFFNYYRFYNDGDAPRGVLRKYGISMHQKELVEEKLEKHLCDFISSILKKYAGKYDRQDFYLDRKISKLQNVIYVTERFNTHSLTNYWWRDVENQEIVTQINELGSQYKIFREKIDEIYPEKSNYSVDSFIEDEEFPSEILLNWKNIQLEMIKIGTKLNIEKLNLVAKKTMRTI